MTAHAKDALRRPSVAQILYLSLAVSTSEAGCAKGLVTGEDRQVFDLVVARAAAVGAVVADEGAIAEEEEVRVGVEEGAARIAAEAVEMPSVSGWRRGGTGNGSAGWSVDDGVHAGNNNIPSSKALPSSRI